MVVSLETMEYLKKGGRISGTQAAIGTLLSIKPIIFVEHGLVEAAERPRTRSRSRERCIELIVEKPIERISILHTMADDVEEFTAEVIRRGNLDPSEVMVSIVGPSVGPHLGPGCIGAAVLYRR
jgi:DegV family protein with EDD domain